MEIQNQSQFQEKIKVCTNQEERIYWCVNESFEVIEKAYRTGFAHGYCRGLEDPENKKKIKEWLFLTLNEAVPFPCGRGFTFEGYEANSHEEMKFKQGFCSGFRLALKNKDLEDEIRDWRYSDYTKIIIPPGHEFAGHVWGVKN